MTPPLGAHESTAGGLALAFGRGEAIGCDALQIFVKNASQWKAKPLADPEIAAFRAAHGKSPIGPLVAHAAYLINLAAPDPTILEKSRAALADELTRCAQVGVPGLVVHPGAHLGRGEEAGLAAIAESLDAVYATIPDCPTTTLLEITAGQGTVLGRKLADLEAIRKQAKEKSRLAVCLDTCHAFAAGYALDDPKGFEDFLAEIDGTVGFDAIRCVHVNDSVGARGSRKDRHANLGEGLIGLDLFARLLAEPRFAQVPMILETPLGDDEQGHARDLATLRSLA
jgi:deoxyribonuclease-4